MPPTKLKRVPVQERSNDTVQQILAAASVLLARMPVDQITTSRIAQEADVSVGGLYRFFPDKQAIIDAIAVKRVEEFQHAVESRIATMERVDGPGFLNLMIDVYVDFLDAHPDFRAIALGRHVSALTRERHAEPGAGPAALVKMFLVSGSQEVDTNRLDLKLRIAIETGERLIDYAFSQPSQAARSLVLQELKGLLSTYLFSN